MLSAPRERELRQRIFAEAAALLVQVNTSLGRPTPERWVRSEAKAQASRERA